MTLLTVDCCTTSDTVSDETAFPIARRRVSPDGSGDDDGVERGGGWLEGHRNVRRFAGGNGHSHAARRVAETARTNLVRAGGDTRQAEASVRADARAKGAAGNGNLRCRDGRTRVRVGHSPRDGTGLRPCAVGGSAQYRGEQERSRGASARCVDDHVNLHGEMRGAGAIPCVLDQLRPNDRSTTTGR